MARICKHDILLTHLTAPDLAIATPRHDMKFAMLSSSQESPAWPDDRTYVLGAEDFSRIRAQLPQEALLLAAPVNNWMDQINPAEQLLVQDAVSSRQSEFSTGRMLTARALREFGVPVAAILRGPMNEPIWPPGITGSITHTTDICMVAVAATRHLVGLGIDIEANRPEFDDIAHLILRPEERQLAAAQALPAKDAVRLVFGAKESLYKAVHGRARRFVDFQEVRIEFEPDSSSFVAIAPDDQNLDAIVEQGTGRYLVVDDIVFATWYQTA